MRLVVMAAVLAMAGVGQGEDCSSACHPTNATIEVEGCGTTESVETTICEGRCFQEDPVYVGARERQTTCNGVWYYKVLKVSGCAVGISYPVARSCSCSVCKARNTYCGRFPGDEVPEDVDQVPGCPPSSSSTTLVY